MKKNIKKLMALMLATATIVCMSVVPASAANATVQVIVDDALVTFPDAQPFIDHNNRTLIPVRFVTEAMKADVSWIQETQTAVIEKDGTKVEITIGKQDIKVTKNGVTEMVKMDTAAVNRESRTYVPIRFVAEALGAYVDYSNLYHIVEIANTDEVTAEEMKRLRSYPMNQTLDLASRNNPGNAWWLNMDEYKSFTNTSYWFSNSHIFLASREQTLPYEVKNAWAKTKLEVGANALDYARFAVQYAEDYMESTGYSVAGLSFKIPGFWNTGSNDTEFRTNDSLCYQMICPPQAIVSVRGVLEYTVEDERAAEILKVQFEEASPQMGETYSYDIEVQVYVDNLNYFDARVYWLKSDGSAIFVKNDIVK